MQFTLVSTIFNEASRLEKTINDLEQQTLQPSEIIITDAGSIDGTYEKLLEWKAASPIPITIIKKPKCNVAEGRNLAIQAAKSPIIASTDFGCRFHPGWLESLVTPFIDEKVDVVSGAYTVREEDQVSLAQKAAYILSFGYTPNVREASFIPSSRSIAYKKEVFDNVGGYCGWLTLAADDLVFGKEILANKYTFYPVDKPFVYWIRHSNAKGFIKEANRYGLGDGESGVSSRNFWSNLISLAMRCCFLLTVLLFWIAPIFFTSSPVSSLVLIIFLPGFRSYFSYTKSWVKFRSSKYNFRVYLYGFYLLEVTRISYIRGYLSGVFYSTSYQREQSRLLKKRLSVS
jgi:glycosyltransferase involved in cell wall biosynthesis